MPTILIRICLCRSRHEAHHPLNNEKVTYYNLTTNRNKGHFHQYRTGFDYQFADNHALNIAYTGSWTSYKSNNISLLFINSGITNVKTLKKLRLQEWGINKFNHWYNIEVEITKIHPILCYLL